MSVSLDTAVEDVMTCPTCRARQPWSNQCRRCRGDLSLLRDAWRACRRARQSCLRHIHLGQVDQALHDARSYAALYPGQDAFQLLAVCQLLANDWSGALTAARAAMSESPSCRI